MTSVKTPGRTVFVREATGLTRSISGFDVLLANLMTMGLFAPIFYIYFASLLYPGVNIPLTVLVALIPAFIMASVYYLFTLSMPRTGGDYVWVSRIIHPSVGTIVSFFVTFASAGFIAMTAAPTISYGLAPMLLGLGQIYSDQNLISLASSLASLPVGFYLSLLVLVVASLPAFMGTKVLFRVVGAFLIFTAIAAVVMIFAFFSAPRDVFISNFNKMSGMNYSDIISKAGIPPGFTLGATLVGAVFTILNFNGFQASAYYTGEVKQLKRSQFLGMMGAIVIFAIFVFIQYSSAYFSFGADFYNAIANLAGSGNPAYTLPVSPVLTLLITYATPHPLVVALVGIGFLTSQLGYFPITLFIVERNVFAWSFDRVMPMAFCKLDRRGTPYITTLTLVILSAIAVWAYWYTTFFAYFLYASLLFLIAYSITCLAAVIFPYVRKDIFESSPDLVKKRVGGIPIITLLGIVGFIVEVFFSYANLLPGVTPPPTGPMIVQLLSYAFVPIVALLGIIMYVAAYYYRKSQGLDIVLNFKQIPPE